MPIQLDNPYIGAIFDESQRGALVELVKRAPQGDPAVKWIMQDAEAGFVKQNTAESILATIVALAVTANQQRRTIEELQDRVAELERVEVNA